MRGLAYLHSHSGIERELKVKKRFVLIDEEFKHMFIDIEDSVSPIVYDKKTYYLVPIMSFIHKGGVFKNFME